MPLYYSRILNIQDDLIYMYGNSTTTLTMTMKPTAGNNVYKMLIFVLNKHSSI